MNINRDNYEAWLLDLIEGRLSPEEEIVLRDFLSEHPECEASVLENPGTRMHRPHLSFEHKDSLKKEFLLPLDSVSRSNFDMACIAAMEGDLNPKQEKEFQLLLESEEELSKKWNDWQQSRLPVQELEYPRKRKLQKRGRVLYPAFLMVGAAAAVIVLFLLIGRGSPDPLNPGVETEIAEDLIKVPGSNQAKPEAVTEESLAMKEPVEQYERTIPTMEGLAEALPEDQIITEPAEIRAPVIKSHRLTALGGVPFELGYYDHIDEVQLASLVGQSQGFEGDEWNNRGLREGYRQFLEEKDINLVRVASAGIDGINTITGSEMDLKVDRNEEGKTRRFHFHSAFFSVDAPVKNNQ